MNIHELKSKFMEKRNFSTENVVELMNFAKTKYIQNEISIKEYRHLVRELEALGSDNPDEQSSLIFEIEH
jgi:hypothetical protein